MLQRVKRKGSPWFLACLNLMERRERGVVYTLWSGGGRRDERCVLVWQTKCEKIPLVSLARPT